MPGTFENPRAELYHLGEDPSEEHDLAGRHPERLRAMSDRLAQWYAETQASATDQPGGWLAE